MIGALSARRRMVIINAPITPTFTSPATLTSTNTLGGNGSFEFQFNANKRTCGVTVVGSVSSSGVGSFTYFGANDLVDPNDYEVMATLGTSVGFSNIAAAGGSATLDVWISLGSSPLFKFSCSGRRGGSRSITISIRHKVNTAVTGSTSITMNQNSDAVTPSFSGVGGTTSVIRTTTDTFLGVYIDGATSANAGQIRTYKNTTLFTQTGWTFSTGSIPESEYEIATSAAFITPTGGLIRSDTSGNYVDLSTFRAKSPAWNSDVARFWSRLGTEPAATGRISITIRHKLDPNKSSFQSFDFATS